MRFEHVQLARLARNVAGREALAQIAVVAVGQAFGQHVAMAFLVEAVDQHPAKAGQRADFRRRQLAQCDDGIGVADLVEEIAHQRVKLLHVGAGRFKLQHQQAVVEVGQHVEQDAVQVHGADAGRALAQASAVQRRRQLRRGAFADHVAQRTTQHLLRRLAGQLRQILAGLQHLQLRR